jgi:hypothetical protein
LVISSISAGWGGVLGLGLRAARSPRLAEAVRGFLVIAFFATVFLVEVFFAMIFLSLHFLFLGSRELGLGSGAAGFAGACP